MRRFVALALFPGLAAAIAGCGAQQAAQTAPPAATAGGEKYLLASEPQGAQGVIELRTNARDGQRVVAVGRIGGSTDPWVEGRAAFSIVDPSLQACSDKEGDPCTTPWDYCCQTDLLPEATALVKVVDDSGRLVAAGARELLGVKELQTVVVEGIAKRDDAGNLTIESGAIYLRLPARNRGAER